MVKSDCGSLGPLALGELSIPPLEPGRFQEGGTCIEDRAVFANGIFRVLAKFDYILGDIVLILRPCLVCVSAPLKIVLLPLSFYAAH